MSEADTSMRDLLVEQVAWLQGLARQLVADEDTARDLAQDALALALERPPRSREGLRGWLATVVRNLSRERLRSRRNEQAREQRTARPERTEGPDELVERVQLQRVIADELLALDEPYRSTVLLRFYEGLAPRKIAARQNVPVATVHSRLQRGLAKLRLRLDGVHDGDRSAWAVILVPWVREGLAPTAVTVGGIALNIKLAAVLGTLVVTGLSYLLLSRLGEPVGPGPESGTAELALSAPADSDVRPEAAAESSEVDVRRAVPEARAQDATSSEADAASFLVRGRVLDADGRAVSGVTVRLTESDERTTSLGGGRFELRTTLESGRIEVDDPRWASVRGGSWRASGSIEPVVLVAPAIDLAGRVFDGWGHALVGARVALVPPSDFESRFLAKLDASLAEPRALSSAADGSFSFERVPAVSGSELLATLPGYEPFVIPCPQATRRDLWIELRRPEPAEQDALLGRVLRADGAPASEALVVCGNTSTTADDEGRFVLDLSLAGEADEVMAAEPGSLPARLGCPGEPSDRRKGWPEPPASVELRLGAATLSISGRVVDDGGEPLADTRVWLGDASSFGRVGAYPLQLEAVLAGGGIPTEAIESIASLADDETPVLGSASPALEPSALLAWVETDDEGRFVLDGLEDRAYTLHVLERGLRWGAIEPDVPAGSRAVEIVVESASHYERVRGRVVTNSGQPLAGVRLTPWIPALHSVDELRGRTVDVMRFFLGQTVVSGDDGSFELAGIPRQHVQFHLVADSIVPSYASVDQIVDPASFDIEVLARVHLEVFTDGSATAPDAFRVTDRDGESVKVLEMRADGYSNYDRFELSEGRSGVLTVTSDAAQLHFLKGEFEVEVVPLELALDRVNTVRF